mmetsp:Transcript_20107/g.55982  ORF Transcript_20107/g.55982 Transcript_20107/m.55982 type:complete len:273 (-) Transcript_20107:100-918(-)
MGVQGLELRRRPPAQGTHLHHPRQVRPRGDRRHHQLLRGLHLRQEHERGRDGRRLHRQRRRQGGLPQALRERHQRRIRSRHHAPEGRSRQPDHHVQEGDQGHRTALPDHPHQEVRARQHQRALLGVRHHLRCHAGTTRRRGRVGRQRREARFGLHPRRWRLGFIKHRPLARDPTDGRCPILPHQQSGVHLGGQHYHAQEHERRDRDGEIPPEYRQGRRHGCHIRSIHPGCRSPGCSQPDLLAQEGLRGQLNADGEVLASHSGTIPAPESVWV